MSRARAILVIDLAFGDCGKGTIVDYLTRRHDVRLIVRFNGGPQAGHNVVTEDGRHHTFSQFGSGTFVPAVRTLLSHHMLIEPYALLNEAAHLADVGVPDVMDRLLIDARCPVITPAHQAANRLREIARGAAGAHGTCGLGVGEAVGDLIDRPELMLRAADLADGATVAARLRAFCRLKRHELGGILDSPLRDDPAARPSIATLQETSWIEVAVENYAWVAARAAIISAVEAEAAIRGKGTVIFEGAQGVLLDEACGFHPHTTWSNTTFRNADDLLDRAGVEPGARTRIGVLRSYFTRHGPGPFVTEDDSLRHALPEPHNDDRGWQGRFRVGAFDAVAARYALEAAGPVDLLALTHLDRLPAIPPRACIAYRVAGGAAVRKLPMPVSTDYIRRCRPVMADLPAQQIGTFLAFIQRELGVPVGIISCGPAAGDKRPRGAHLSSSKLPTLGSPPTSGRA